MTILDIDGYMKQEDDGVRESSWQRLLACAPRAMRFVAISSVVVLLVCGITPGEHQAQTTGGHDNESFWPSSMRALVRKGSYFAPVGQYRLRAKVRSKQRMALQRTTVSPDVRARAAPGDDLSKMEAIPPAPAPAPGTDNLKVPLDSFGGLSPERKAAQQLDRFFTLVAIKAVLHQLESAVSPQADSKIEPSKDKADIDAADKQRRDYEDLRTFYETEPVKDPDEWVQTLMKQNKSLAFRIMEARKAYAGNEFEWDWLRGMTVKALHDGNDAIMRRWAEKAFEVPIPGESTNEGESANDQERYHPKYHRTLK